MSIDSIVFPKDNLIVVENEVMINTSFGGGIWDELPQLRLIIIPGERNYVLQKDQMARYSVEAIWTPESGDGPNLERISWPELDYRINMDFRTDSVSVQYCACCLL